jgi:hypothetical protein
MYLQKVISEKTLEKNVFLLASTTDESVVRIRIRTKMSRIHNTDFARVLVLLLLASQGYQDTLVFQKLRRLPH